MDFNKLNYKFLLQHELDEAKWNQINLLNLSSEVVCICNIPLYADRKIPIRWTELILFLHGVSTHCSCILCNYFVESVYFTVCMGKLVLWFEINNYVNESVPCVSLHTEIWICYRRRHAIMQRNMHCVCGQFVYNFDSRCHLYWPFYRPSFPIVISQYFQ